MMQPTRYSDNPYIGANVENQNAHVTESPMKNTAITIDRPQEWPLSRKMHVSAVAWVFSFVAAFGATAYTTDIAGVQEQFKVSSQISILGFSLYLWGIALAPIWVPHMTPRIGRRPLYFIGIFISGWFVLGAGLSQNFTTLAICRFFAGFFAGPSLILIEGTFADVWSADRTNSYYSILGISSYFGAAAGPLILGFIIPPQSWRYTQYVTALFFAGALLFGFGMPETFPRQLAKVQAKRLKKLIDQGPILSGDTLGDIIGVTLVTPIIMLVSEPLVMFITIFLGLNFGVIFGSFIFIPMVMKGVYGFHSEEVALVFNSPIIGAGLAAITSILIDKVAAKRELNQHHGKIVNIEYRLWPAIIGAFGVTISMFWIGFTASPNISPLSPIAGTVLYVWGNLSILISFISYLFDAYPPRGTLSALTAAATFRVLMAGLIPLVIWQMFAGLGGKWALGTFGCIYAALLPGPFVLYKLGPKLRANSRYSAKSMPMSKYQPIDEEMRHSMEQSTGL